MQEKNAKKINFFFFFSVAATTEMQVKKYKNQKKLKTAGGSERGNNVN